MGSMKLFTKVNQFWTCYNVLMIKKSLHKKVLEVNKKQIIIHKSPLTYFVAALLVLALIGAVAFGAYKYSVTANNKARLSKIIDIYTDLQLEEAYRPTKANVFGDKRVYEWDSGRTYASSVEYAHKAAPADVRASLRKKVEGAGFKFVQTEYEGSIRPIDEFKNEEGNYIRVAVTSKYVNDKYTFGDYDLDDPLVNHSNEAPSYVEVKVNLDDNNE